MHTHIHTLLIAIVISWTPLELATGRESGGVGWGASSVMTSCNEIVSNEISNENLNLSLGSH